MHPSSKHKENAILARSDWKLAFPSVGALGNRLPAKDLMVLAVKGVAKGLESKCALEFAVGSEDSSSSPSELCDGSSLLMASGPPPEYDRERRSLYNESSKNLRQNTNKETFKRRTTT